MKHLNFLMAGYFALPNQVLEGSTISIKERESLPGRNHRYFFSIFTDFIAVTTVNASVKFITGNVFTNMFTFNIALPTIRSWTRVKIKVKKKKIIKGI